MNLCVRIAFTSLWLSLTSFISAQVGFSLPFVNNITPLQTVNYPITVTGFDSIAGANFVIRWDPLVFQYETIDNFNLDALDPGDFGTTQVLDSGILRMQWEAPLPLAGVTLPDETAIFRLRLKAIGPVNSGSTVIFTEALPTPFEIVRVNSDSSLTAFNINEVDLTQGFGAIGYTVSAAEPIGRDAEDFSVQIFPNPFYEKTQVNFDLKNASDVHFAVTDAAGRTLVEKVLPQLPSGQHGIEIASPLLREKGAYFLILRTETQSCARPLFVF
jgi:hypothetical protein